MTSHLTKKDKTTLERAKKQLEEGAAVLAKHQKNICIANQSEQSWGYSAVVICKGNDLVANEETPRKLRMPKR